VKRIFSKKQVIRRYTNNPIITPDMLPFNCRGVFNSSVVKHDGRYVMILRCEGYNFYNFFVLAESENGLDNWKIGEIIPLPEDDEYRKYARVQYDPRITKIADTYYVTYCAHGSDARIAMLSSTNMRDFVFEGFISGTGFRNTVLFPEKIDGLYVALERPNALGEIWVTHSPDLKYWGNQKLMMTQAQCNFGWGKIGPCGTPIRTNHGWLIVFHAVSVVCDYEYIYNAGVALADLSSPSKLIRVGEECIMTPETLYEHTGHTPNCVFASSHVVEDDGSMKLYYGASDRCQCVAETSVAELLDVALNR
jgi:beta-1,2-mannobiose phosphorylase / 1,2-beta-oligomannan phosphorylase